MTVSEYVFDFLEKHGLKTVYMVSGSSAMWLTDSLCRNKKLKAICTHHEQAAVMAADLYGRTMNVPGTALVTIGPGATNAITGVAEAFLDSSPLFVVSGQANSRLLQYMRDSGIRQDGTQALDIIPVVSSITKYAASVMDAAEIRPIMEKAWYEAMSGRRGPVWIDVPVDIQNKPVPDDMPHWQVPENGKNPSDEDMILEKTDVVLERLRHAKKPLVLAGGGVSKQALNDIVEKIHVPVVTSRMGIDRIDSENQYFVGRIGAYGQRAAHFAIQQCDFLLSMGCRFSVSSVGYYPERFAPDAWKVQVDVDAKELNRSKVHVDLRIKCDCRIFSELLCSSCSDNSFDFSAWTDYCNDLRKRYPVVLNSYRRCVPLNSYYFTQLLAELSPEDAAVVVDTGSVCNVVSQTWKVKDGQSFLISGGLSCMGFWAGSMGACAAGRTVLALSGDGSVSMNVQEFATLAYNKLPVKLFVYNNNGYMLIRHNQHNYMNDRFLGVGPDSGLQTPDYCKVAAAYGLPSVRIQAGDDMEAKIQEVLSTNGPVVCEIILEQFGPMAPRISSKVMPDGSLKAAEFDDLAPFLDDDEKPLPYAAG